MKDIEQLVNQLSDEMTPIVFRIAVELRKRLAMVHSLSEHETPGTKTRSLKRHFRICEGIPPPRYPP